MQEEWWAFFYISVRYCSVFRRRWWIWNWHSNKVLINPYRFLITEERNERKKDSQQKNNIRKLFASRKNSNTFAWVVIRENGRQKKKSKVFNIRTLIMKMINNCLNGICFRLSSTQNSKSNTFATHFYIV